MSDQILPNHVPFIDLSDERQYPKSACMFRTKKAVEEIGEDKFFDMYIKRVKLYDAQVGEKIESWLNIHKREMPSWEGLGHQKLIMAEAR